jgi:hypothetical protein
MDNGHVGYLDMHNLGGGMIYCISILENFSRAILASAIFVRARAVPPMDTVPNVSLSWNTPLKRERQTFPFSSRSSA